MKKHIIAAFACLLITQSASAYRVVVVQQPRPKTSIQQFAKSTLQNAAGLTTIGALGYGGYQLIQSIRFWLQSNENNPTIVKKSQLCMSRFLVALLIAASAGTIATADLSSVNFNVHFDIVRALELLLKSQS